MKRTGSRRIDYTGEITYAMPQRRRSSLVDQMALLAASEQFMEGISEGDGSDGAGTDDNLDDGTAASNDQTLEDRELVFNTDLDDASQDYSIELAPATDESISMIDYRGADESLRSESEEISKPPLSFRNRASFMSEHTSHSAPNHAGHPVTDYGVFNYEPAEAKGFASKAERRRPLSITVPNAAGAADSRSGMKQRRKSHRLVKPKIKGIGEEAPTTHSVQHQNSGSILGFGRRSSRKVNQGSMTGSNSEAFGNAIEKLRNQDANSEWESVAAAVAVVQESERRPTSNTVSRHNQFDVGDTVLVFLTLLNVTNMEDPKDTFTIAAVNMFGYPEGEGRTEDERKGPYNFVLATVKQLHFEEDDRYYTVIRADTGTEQRADSGWMEPLSDPAGLDAAYRAAKRTFRSQSDQEIELMEEGYHNMRMKAKFRVSQLLYGDSPFACRIRVTGINFLVSGLVLMCLTDDFAPLLRVVWGILVVELLLEILIRPKGYSHLMESDKAFAPSTARHISTFHIFFEGIALVTFIPEFWCLVDETESCYRGQWYSRLTASEDAILGEDSTTVVLGRFMMGLTALRFFGVVRHWKQMWINSTFHASDQDRQARNQHPPTLWTSATDSAASAPTLKKSIMKRRERMKRKTDDDVNESTEEKGDEVPKSQFASSEEDQRLKNAATIGTALMVVNSQRALVLLSAITIILPLVMYGIGTNPVATELTRLLQANNIQANTVENECDYLESVVDSWLNVAVLPQPSSFASYQEDLFVLWAQLLPKRCDWQRNDGIITVCSEDRLLSEKYRHTCDQWMDLVDLDVQLDSTALRDGYGPINIEMAHDLNIRPAGTRIVCVMGDELVPCSRSRDDVLLSNFNVTVVYNDNPTISLALQALRSDAIRLVLDPLQRMLKIVLQCKWLQASGYLDVKSGSKSDFALEKEAEEIGNFETEQLISAITKIADLLRKCWGVAGAGIISSNLARTVDGKTVVFNPTVPGKRVYALFGFVAINGFGDQLRRLDRDVMILINDVARVVHNEVYRWALGDHGQCNKNLGASFLMVFRIGDFSEVHKKRKIATEKLFRSNKGNKKSNAKQTNQLRQRRRSNLRGTRRNGRQADDGQINLASLPGIQGFTDRALLGMLKSFAGIHRDRNLYLWQNDFRLSDGVGNYCVDIIFGMDAGWAVEGAVGSEHKIDATYLSPHVNMASRMTSATKQYGLTILLSKAVEELLSKNCRKKLRHVDTVYVKGSNVKQDIFTYDARHQGVDFFLFERTPTQADIDADSYTPNIWDHDQDLIAMRQHISDAFVDLFKQGMKKYLSGNWKEAYDFLEQADNKMIERILDEGYIEIDLDEFNGDIFDRTNTNEDMVRLRQELGDGPCRVLMTYMKGNDLVAPPDWNGVRKLFSK
eukprot:scaffold8529_cov137-Cylindrotheca_fusiformis.AAC.16